MEYKNFRSELNKEFDVSKNAAIAILFKTKPVPYSGLVLNVLRSATDRGMGGVYLASAYPHHYITDKLEDYGVDKKNLFCIDTVSWMAGKPSGLKEGCVFIKNPSTLEEVETWTLALMGQIKTKNKFLFIDSVSNMLIHNDINALEKFTKSLIGHMEGNGNFNGLQKFIFLVGAYKEAEVYKTLRALFEEKKLKIKEIRM